MQNLARTIVVVGTGGTIAGRAESAADNVGYRAGQVPVGELLAALPVARDCTLRSEQLAQLDSKDMDHATWQALARCVAGHLADPAVAGIVVTHGTDTLEETAWFLQRVLAPRKPVALTAAMRPATSLLSDGPQNLADALAVALHPDAAGVVAVLAGVVHASADIRKSHSYRLAAFDSGDAGALALVEEGRLRVLRAWPSGTALGLAAIAADPARWPWVEIVTSHAGANGRVVDACVAAGVSGLVVAGTGNGTLHRELAAALERAAAAGVAVRRSSRCAAGPVLGDGGGPWPASAVAGAPKARVELLLELLAAP